MTKLGRKMIVYKRNDIIVQIKNLHAVNQLIVLRIVEMIGPTTENQARGQHRILETDTDHVPDLPTEIIEIGL